MERKLATVLFVDLVDSTGLLAGADPEVVRRRVTRYFEEVSHCIEAHGGTVEKFAGDAVMAAFGIPRAHEDDAERALRAALAVRSAVFDLGLQARIGVEAGEVVADDADSTFATGEAVNVSARLEQAAPAGEILIGAGVTRLAGSRVEAEEVAPIAVSGREEPVRAWRLLSIGGGPGRPLAAAPLIGREEELELLHNTYARAVRDGRAHLVTVFGEPGIGKSRLVYEFTEGVERATILSGRALPYGEGVTYWPLAEMVKQSAGITDDDPAAEAFEKLRTCCESEAVADLLGAATGLLGAAEQEQTREELVWAALAWAEQLAETQPAVLVFEDVHWAGDPLLDVIDHLAQALRDVPVLLVAVARTELLDTRPAWGGGNPRSVAVELAPLTSDESQRLADALVAGGGLPPTALTRALAKAEGNPLFLEETIRMLVEREGGEGRIPDTIQALIASRIDALRADEKRVLQRAAVVGRVFWRGAIRQLAPGSDVDGVLETLLQRELIAPEARSTIPGDDAFRFRHVLIREVAYGGLAKGARAELHAGFAAWIAERAGDELLEIRAHHLEQASTLLEELDGAAPEELRRAAADALTEAGKRNLVREVFRTARRQLVRAVDLEPTLRRRYLAARAAWRLSDFPAVAEEMEAVAAAAEADGERRFHGQALTALAEIALYQDADPDRAAELVERALEALGDDDHVDARFELLGAAGKIASWLGDLDEVDRLARESLALARGAGRKDLEAVTIQSLATTALLRLDVQEGRELVRQAQELAAESGSLRARSAVLAVQAWLAEIEGRPEEAELLYRERIELLTDIGDAIGAGQARIHLSGMLLEQGEFGRAAPVLREAIRILKQLGDRGFLCEVQRMLAQVLVAQGRLDDAERLALEARRTVGPDDRYSIPTTTMALGIVRAAQGRDEEAELLLREAVEMLEGSSFRAGQRGALRELARFLRERGRDEEAAVYEGRGLELVPSSAERIA